MERTGLLDDILQCAAEIGQGRKWLDTEGQEYEGRVTYRQGLALAMDAFQQIQSLAAEDLELLLLAEYTFVAQELQLCAPEDTQAISSLKSALQSFDDAFITLKAVADAALYKGADMTYPQDVKYRIKGMPKDAFHIMCIAHRVRVNNILRTPGTNLSEKKLLIQRQTNINAAQAVYLDKQQNVLQYSC